MDYKEPTEAPTLLNYIWSYRGKQMKGIGLTLLRAIVIAPLPFLFRIVIDEHV